MNENYEATEVAIRKGLCELITWLKDEIKTASKEPNNGKSSEFSQSVDAYDKLFKLYQGELSRDLEYDIKYAELEQKQNESEADIVRKNEELNLKRKDILANISTREREADVKEREADTHELSAKENAKWYNRPIVGSLLASGTVIVVNGIAILINASEAPLRNLLQQWMIKPRI